jgi:hypothetical protein
MGRWSDNRPVKRSDSSEPEQVHVLMVDRVKVFGVETLERADCRRTALLVSQVGTPHTCGYLKSVAVSEVVAVLAVAGQRGA